jgi:hypothetical protein
MHSSEPFKLDQEKFQEKWAQNWGGENIAIIFFK